MGATKEHDECPIHNLTKKDLIWYATNHCRHGHTYLEHWRCRPPAPKTERIGFLDIETSNLQADFGIILTYCIKDSKSSKIFRGVLTREDIDQAKPGQEDAKVVRKLIQDMKGFDRLVTYYGARFDIPFIRTRAMACKIPFPRFGTLVHSDLYFTVKSRFRLSSNRLDTACRCILGKTEKTRINGAFWRAGTRGDPKSLRHILFHNEKDVLDLERLWNAIHGFSKVYNRSM